MPAAKNRLSGTRRRRNNNTPRTPPRMNRARNMPALPTRRRITRRNIISTGAPVNIFRTPPRLNVANIHSRFPPLTRNNVSRLRIRIPTHPEPMRQINLNNNGNSQMTLNNRGNNVNRGNVNRGNNNSGYISMNNLNK